VADRKYFGTDGIRGNLGEGAITPEFMLKLGWACGQVFKKSNGRNRVIQLGSGSDLSTETSPESKKGWLSWFQSQEDAQVSEINIVTPVPVDLAIEKLRGFIADHNAEVIAVRENHVSLKLNALCGQGGRRRADQVVGLKAEMTLREMAKDPKKPLSWKRTNVHLHLQPVRNRDRRSGELAEAFRQVTASLNSYLMGQVLKEDTA